ncbi:type II toxin-antitoxin system RelE/ParE family toxin [bacterium]|nr:type II toxin-antitoxin system RelE/ParE family toxin [bacterium]
MPRTQLLIYCEEDGTVPLLEWFNKLPDKAVIKCRARMEILEERGHEAHRPIADYLKDGIYELRVSFQGIHHRILYFFYNNKAIVLSHGLLKERQIPEKEIEKALQRKMKFLRDPQTHTFEDKKT